MSEQVTVVAAVIERDGRILVARRAAHSKLAGSWEFPGGKVEAGESHEAALARELHEELRVTARIAPGPPVAVSDWEYDHAHVRLVGLRAEIVSGDPVPLDHSELRWVTHEELDALPLLPADRPIADAITGRPETPPR
jgi:mutator protein MutT